MILIVGGAGYIGSHVNKYLNQKGYETIVYDNLSTGHREFVKWGEFILGDLCDRTQLRQVFRNYKIDAVMHFAAFAYVGESVKDPEKYYYNNVANTITLLSVMREFAVKNFIFSSTCATYGEVGTLPIDENQRQSPINPYGRSKFMIEQIIKDYEQAYGLQSVSLRYFNAAGADIEGEIGEKHNPETHLIPLVLDVALGKSSHISIFGTDYQTIDGTCIRDYIHVMDLAQAHVLALEYLVREGKTGVFNLGNGRGVSVREIIDVAMKVTGRNIKVVEKMRRVGDPAILIGSSDKVRAILGWKPQYESLDVIIKTAWEWQKKLI